MEQIILLRKMLEDMGISVDEGGEFDATEVSDAVDEPVSLNGNSGTPASYRKPPPHCDNNLDFL